MNTIPSKNEQGGPQMEHTPARELIQQMKIVKTRDEIIRKLLEKVL